MKMPEIQLRPGQEYDGFRVCDVTPVEEIFAIAYRFEHQASGARLLHVHTHDAENAFSINFPTPPPDDTGMPHILEHSVLAGSRKFPVKEPFFEMIKMSMATFINAMTGYDCTYYPVCSNVPRDLFNLADVYMDAVFHPLLSATTFQREAHHLAPVDPKRPDGPLRRDGIVYSEMKGAFSDPMARLQRLSVRALLPDTCYGRESGGDPDAIPDLSLSQLKAFHAAHYHPGNAYFVFYGNIPPGDYLDFLRPRLADYQQIVRPDWVTRQPRWSEPRLRHDRYPIGAQEQSADKSFLALNWRVGDATDPKTAALWHILALALLGNEGAPLRRAIVDAHLGGDLVLAGAGAAGCEATFHVGIQGSAPERLDDFRALVLDQLATLAATPLDAESVAAAFQQAAYHFLEIVPMYPLFAVMRVVDAWIYSDDPLRFLRMRAHLDSLRRDFAADPMLFSRAIRASLLDNPHRLDIVLEPDPEWQSREDARQAQRMQGIGDKFNHAQRQRIAADAEALDALNGRPNAPEELARLPQLTVADLPAEPAEIPTRVDTLEDGAPLLINDVFSNGVLYLKLGFDLTGLPAEHWPWLPRYIEALNKMGAAGLDYAGIARRVSAFTGGISASASFETHFESPGRLLPTLTLSLKALDVRLDPALSVLRDLLFALDPRARDRAHDVALQARTHYRNALIQQGQATVLSHSARGMNPAGYLGACVSGLPQLALCERWVAEFDTAFAETAGHIEAIREFIANRRRLSVSVTGMPASVRTVQKTLSQWLGDMRDSPIAETDTGFQPFDLPPSEGLAAPIQISHCAMTLPAPHFSSPDEPLLAVGAHLITLDYMMNEIRFKGNAYGAGFSHKPLTGLLSMSSFRDPHLARTLAVFQGVADYVHKVCWSQSDIDRAIIGVAKHDSKPIRPGEATGQALQRHRTGWTQARRVERRRGLLRATPDSVRRVLLEMLEENLPRAAVCVMAGREMLEAANAEAAGNPLAISEVFGSVRGG